MSQEISEDEAREAASAFLAQMERDSVDRLIIAVHAPVRLGDGWMCPWSCETVLPDEDHNALHVGTMPVFVAPDGCCQFASSEQYGAVYCRIHVPEVLGDLWSRDRQVQGVAFKAVMALVETPVDWAYSVWDAVVAHLNAPDNHDRAIAAQVLSGLAGSDPELRILRDFDALFAVVYDERFVTARHALQNLWRVGVAGEAPRVRLLRALETRFEDCAAHKNCTLIRYDICAVLAKVWAATRDEAARDLALRLIASENDEGYRRKYQGLFKV